MEFLLILLPVYTSGRVSLYRPDEGISIDQTKQWMCRAAAINYLPEGIKHII